MVSGMGENGFLLSLRSFFCSFIMTARKEICLAHEVVVDISKRNCSISGGINSKNSKHKL